MDGADAEAVGVIVTENEPPEERLSAEATRELPLDEITRRLEAMIIRISAQSGSPLSSPVSTDTPVSLLGMDSLSLVQFNGVLQKK